MGAVGEFSYKRALVRLLDRPGGRLFLGKIATRFARRAMEEDVEIAYVEGLWTHRVGPLFFPDGPRFNYTPPDFDSWKGQLERYVSETNEFWLQHYHPQEGDVVIDVGAGRRPRRRPPAPAPPRPRPLPPHPAPPTSHHP